MAQDVLFKVVKPPAACKCSFSGRKDHHDNPEFSGKDYQVAVMFEDLSESFVDERNQVTGFKQHPLKVIKYLDIDTPFFKECLLNRYTIPEMSFHFFHNDGKESYPVNYFTIIMKDVKIIRSTVSHHDTSIPHKPNEHVSNPNKDRSHLEELLLTASDITWKYKRNTEPRKEEKATQMKIGTPTGL